MRLPTICHALPLLAPPAIGEVHFWCLFPDEVWDPTLLRYYESLLCPEERKHVCQVNTDNLRKERLLTRTLARTTLARYAGGHADPSSLKFERNKSGKPKVIWPEWNSSKERWKPPQLCFNLSHTSSLIACGVTSNLLVGVDVEEKGRALKKDVLAFAQRKFSLAEAAWLETFSNPEERHHRFMQLWTLKEAYVKALGSGIGGTSLREFSFKFSASPDVPILLEKAAQLPIHEQAYSISLELLSSREKNSNAWKFFLFQPTYFHYASICMEQCKVPGQGERQMHVNDFKVQTWKTVPYVEDTSLGEGALALASSV